MKAGPKIARSVKTLAIVTAVIYVIFFAVNVFLQSLLESGVKIRDVHIEAIERNSHIEDQVRIISRVTKLYKDTKLQNPDVGESLEHVAGVLEDTVTIKELIYERDHLTYELLAEASRATSYARLIAGLLESEEVDSITINYVEYITSNRSYNASLEVQMK